MKFFSSSKLVTAFQFANLAAGSIALYDLLTNPEADNWFTGIDVGVHYLTYFAFNQLESNASRLGALVMNMAFCGTIISQLSSDADYPPLPVLVIDLLFHFANSACAAFKEVNPVQETFHTPVVDGLENTQTK